MPIIAPFQSVHLVYHPEVGLIAAKVMKQTLFDENEWNAAGKLQSGFNLIYLSYKAYINILIIIFIIVLFIFRGHPIPFIVQFISARVFVEYVVILLEFANLKVCFTIKIN